MAIIKKFMLIISIMYLTIASVQANTLLVMGDSLSAAHNIPLEKGWVNLLQHKVTNAEKAISDQKWQIVNASISGETTSGGLARLPKLLEKHSPDICVIELGANDGLRGLSLKKMKNNLSKMIELCKNQNSQNQKGIAKEGKAKKAKVLLLGIWLPPNYGTQYTKAFNATYPRLAEEFNVELIPFLLEGIADKPELMQKDGLHPTAEAQPIILESVWVSLLRVFRK